MSYRLICIDMDGTLLNDNHEVTEENKLALKEAVNKGVKIAITTGRLFTSARQYAELLGINASIIASNGSYVREKDEEKVIYKHPLNIEQFNKICDVLDKYNVKKFFNTFNTMITTQMPPEDHGYVRSNKFSPEHLKIQFKVYENLRESFDSYKEDILKAIVIDNNIEVLSALKKELKSIGGLEVVSSGHDNVEIMAEGTSKGNGVKAFAEILGIKREEIICIGDNENDISMIKYAGLGVAMGNATEEVKGNADYITDDNNSSGVGKVINKFILNK